MSQALGRGLSALIEESAQTANEINEGGSSRSLDTMLLSKLQPGKYQPRYEFDDESIKELAQSIKEQGILQPIIIRPKGGDVFEIVAGERRFRAAKIAGLTEAPVIIKQNLTDTQALEIALIENIQRQNLTPVEEAEGYLRLQKEFNYTQEKLAGILGKSRSHITNLLRLLSLSDKIKDHVNNGSLSMGHARALVSAENPEELAEQIISKNLSVRDVEKLAKQGKPEREDKKPTQKNNNNNINQSSAKEFSPVVNNDKKDEDLIELERALSKTLGLKVDINETSQGGVVALHFSSLSELDKILQKLGED